MKINSLTISNFRGIKDVILEDLGSMVIIAGQNGSGKSCIFDAIRLLKSVYGGYQQNEWQQWMGEFQIVLTNRSSDFSKILNDVSRELNIECEFCLADEERKYILENAEELLREKIFRSLIPEAFGWGSLRMSQFASQFREKEEEVREKTKIELGVLENELSKPTILGKCFIPSGGSLMIENSVALTLIFSTFRPKHIGVIDYHGAQRHYGRESINGINLNIEVNEQQQSQTALYNYSNKYNNVKSEMAGSYIKEILAEAAGVPKASQSTLTNTLQELFTTFFPEKQFLGPQPTPEGGLTFPVKTTSANLHDLDELSAGEKEILYGYLRIRNSAPLHSIVLLDEPELHLNPRLIRGLPQFYQKNLSEALGNQIWLVTHSDALLREVVGNDNYNVYHMLPCGSMPNGETQLKKLSASADLELALVDLVGDLAAYRPGGKVVIFEGGGDSDFDKKMVSTLFPELQQQANLISGSNKSRVRALHEILDRASSKGDLPFKFYSITDRDSEIEQSKMTSTFTWDVYHIENFLLDSRFIYQVLNAIGLGANVKDSDIDELLLESARETISDLVRHDISEFANQELIKSINLGTNPKNPDLVNELDNAIERSIIRINESRNEALNKSKLTDIENGFRSKYEQSLTDGSWKKLLRGRDILKRFCGVHATQVTYIVFRNLILSKMNTANYRPKEMELVIEKILAKD